MAVALAENPLGLVTVDDRLRPDASLAIQRLRDQGQSVAMLSGDRRQTVERVGRELGFADSDLAWQLLPHQKL